MGSGRLDLASDTATLGDLLVASSGPSESDKGSKVAGATGMRVTVERDVVSRQVL